MQRGKRTINYVSGGLPIASISRNGKGSGESAETGCCKTRGGLPEGSRRVKKRAIIRRPNRDGPVLSEKT